MTAAVLAVFLVLGAAQGTTYAAETTVVISEVMWDGVEYVELYNTGEASVDLSGWTLTRQQLGGDVKTLVDFEESVTIAAESFYLTEKKEEATTVAGDLLVSGLTLVNTGEQLVLKDGDGVVVDMANELDTWFAGENTTLGVAMERTDYTSDGAAAGSWHTSTGSSGGRDGTPGAANSEPYVNAPPEAEVSVSGDYLIGEELTFLADESFDEDGDDLSYSWSLGDGTSATGVEVTHSYNSVGDYVVALTVSDGELDDEVEVTIEIEAPEYSDDVVINEFLVNPNGSDTDGEFIELKNTGDDTVDLTGWELDDEEDGGSSPYTIESEDVGAGDLVEPISKMPNPLC